MSRQYKDKEKVLFRISEGENFNNKPFDLYRNDRDCVLAALKAGVSFSHYPQQWLGDREMSHAFLAFRKTSDDQFCASTIGTALLADKDFILGVLSEIVSTTHFQTYLVLSNKLKSDIDIAVLVVTHNPEVLLMMNDSLRWHPAVQHAFIEGIDQDFDWIESLNIAGDQLALPIRLWGQDYEKDDFHRMIDRRAFSQILEGQLPARSVDQQTIKI